MDVSTYFHRIGVPFLDAADFLPNHANLELIHKRHLLTFPFENLDVYLTGKVGLDIDALIKKVLVRKRGGWCFELNQLLCTALQTLGYQVRPLMARSMIAPGKPRSHQILLVESEQGLFICDTGFGGNCINNPHPLVADVIINHSGLDFRLVIGEKQDSFVMQNDPDLWILQVFKDNRWQDLYGFTLERFTIADFLLGNHYHVSSVLSAFTNQRMVIKVSEAKRWILLDKSVREYVVENKQEIVNREYLIASAAELQAELRSNANIDLTDHEAEIIYCEKPALAQVQTF